MFLYLLIWFNNKFDAYEKIDSLHSMHIFCFVCFGTD